MGERQTGKESHTQREREEKTTAYRKKDENKDKESKKNETVKPGRRGGLFTQLPFWA